MGQRWWSIESIRAFPIGWVDVFVITPTLPVCVGGGCGVSGVAVFGGRGEAPRGGATFWTARVPWRWRSGDGGGRSEMVEVAGHLDPSLDGARLRRGGRRGEGQARSGLARLRSRGGVPRQNMSYRDGVHDFLPGRDWLIKTRSLWQL